MTEVLIVVSGILATFALGFYVLRFAKADPVQRHHWTASALFLIATLSPIAVTLLSPRTGSGSGFTEFSDAPQTAAVSAIIRGVGYLFIAALPMLVLTRANARIVFPTAALALLAYAGAGLVSSLVNDQRVSVDLFYAALTVTCILSAKAVPLADALRLSRFTLRVYVWMSLVLAIAAPHIAFWDGQGRTWFGLSQLAGATTHPNGMGTVAALALIVELVRVDGLKRPRPWHLFASVAALLATQSRGAWLSAAIGLVVYLAFRSGARWVTMGVPVLMGGMLTASAFLQSVFNSLTNWSAGGDITTLNGRTTIWANALNAVQLSPIFGTGPRSFDLDYRSEVLGLNGLISSSNAHNQLIQTLVERGALGLVALLVFLLILARAAFNVGNPSRPGLLAVLAVFVARFAVETPLNISTASLNGALLVVVTVLIVAAKKETHADPLPAAGREVRLPSAYRRMTATKRPFG